MPTPEVPILPATGVGALLDRYPHLEDVLIALAPPFRKLKNPLLRKGVARVASLQHAAIAGGIPVGELVSKLRAIVGQPALDFENCREDGSYFTDQPEWFNVARIVTSIDENESDPDKMPIASILQAAAHLRALEIIELITSFIPAPGIEILRSKGFLVWSVRDKSMIRTYVSKPGIPASEAG
ncbi:MAG TPA: DUF1858 domain-containing protein [Bryobacteraceae bacterium]|nr:DUF1858 domain-containing protein [Bryobacteraceae bacterium]